MTHDVAAALARIRERIERARRRSPFDQNVTLVAVSKTVAVERIRPALEAGQTVFGENRVQEALPKIEAIPEASWHLVGHLQGNKARPAAGAFAWIQSVDSLRLAQRLDSICDQIDKTLPVLCEINVGGEASKSGFPPDEFRALLPQIQSLRHLEPRGLMTVVPQVKNPADARPFFRALREIRDDVEQRYGLSMFSELSMGMTDDFEVAIEEGATIVRIGRAIFGERSPVGIG